MRFPSLFAWLVLLLSCSSEVYAPFYFAGKDSRLRITDPRAKVVLRKPIQNFQGTLETSDAISTSLVGEPIIFSSGIVERNGASASWTGQYDPSNNGVITLQGSSQMRAQPGMVFNGMHVSGAGNLIEGTPKFSEPIQLADGQAELHLSIQNKLTHDVHLNGGRLVLQDTLSIGDDVSLIGNGVIDINSHTLNFPGKRSVWSGDLYFQSATDVTLNAVTVLTSAWYFGPNNSTAVLQGNGNLLDVSGGGQIHVQNGVGLGVTDIVIKGLGDTQGGFVMWDSNSTLSLSNAVLHFTSNYSFTQGNLYFYGANSMLVTGTNVVTIGNAVATIDTTTLEYDTLAFPDMHPIVPSVPDGVHLIALNGGRLICRPVGVSYGASLYMDIPFYQQPATMSIDGTNYILNFRGNNAAGNMTWDGGGYSMQFSRGSAQAGSLVVAANQVVTLQNIVLKDFSSSAVSLGSGASLVFGNGVTIELGANESLNMTWSFTGQTTPSIIHGNGKCLALDALGGGNNVAISVGAGEGAGSPVTLNIEDVHLTGLKGGVALDTLVSTANTYSTNSAYLASTNVLRCVDYTGVINLRNVDLNLAGNYTLSAGSINIYNDVVLRGKGYQFAFSSNGTLAIKSGATFLIDRNVTFSYDSSGLGDLGGDGVSGASKTQLTMADQTSRLFLNGCTFYGTQTSPTLQTGVLVVSDHVTLQSEGAVDAESIVLSDAGGLRIEVLAGAILDVYGALAYQ